LVPVQFLSFTALKNDDNSISLNWSTSHNITNYHFEIEKSLNGKNWTRLGVKVVTEIKDGVKFYNYKDKNVAGPVAFYRLKQIDPDGKSGYSAVRVIWQNAKSSTTKS
jgi:hypothetical protein